MWFLNFGKYLDIATLIPCFLNVFKYLLKGVMTQLFYNALHIWLSALIQLAITLTSLIVRWQDGLSTPWWRRHKSRNGRKTPDQCTRFVRSYPLRFFCRCSDFRQVIEYFRYWLEQFIYHNNISMFYISLHAVFPVLMLQIYQTGDSFYLHCSFCRGQMGRGWGWALINQV